jgi:prepilin-type processing-associated H-X9-DG protein
MNFWHRASILKAKQQLTAFSLVDLVAVLAALGVLAAILGPSLANNQTAAYRAICLNNHRQLAGAWLSYAEDNNGRLAGNLDGGSSLGNTNRTWCVGWLDLINATADNTNTAIMLASQLGAYTRSPRIYKCPADRSVGPVPGGAKLPRVRSVSMNSYMGDRASSYTAGYRQFRSLEEIIEPSPGRALVFLDERDDSINDGWFGIDMNGYDPRNPEAYIIVDYPADWHNRAGNLSFADGHAETRRWADARTMPMHRFGVPMVLGQSSPGNPDVAWIQERTSRKNL